MRFVAYLVIFSLCLPFGHEIALGQGSDIKPTFKTLALCLAAHDRERALSREANARLVAARLFSEEERQAISDQSRHSRQAGLIRQVCDEMKLAEDGLTPAVVNAAKPAKVPGSGDELREVQDLIDILDPLRGTASPITRRIQDENVGRVKDAQVALGGTMDEALADLRASDFGSSSSRSAVVGTTGMPAPVFGKAAADDLQADLANWQREEAVREAERRRLAAIEAQRRADRERIAMAQRMERQRIEAEQEAERRESSSGFWNTLATIGGIGLGALIASEGGASPADISTALQGMAMGQAYSGGNDQVAAASAQRQQTNAACAQTLAQIEGYRITLADARAAASSVGGSSSGGGISGQANQIAEMAEEAIRENQAWYNANCR
jgi:hypothetical protein